MMLAGGGAYVFAKRSINADKKARHEEELKRRRLKDTLDAEFSAKPPSPKQGHKKPHDHAHSPSTEASHDPAPTEHPLDNEENKAQEERSYLATKPYKSRKGDRFS